MTGSGIRAPQTAYVPHDLPAPVPPRRPGPLSGMAVAVKDSFDIAGTRTGGGSPQWLAAQPPATQHADAVALLLDAGARIVGKTICDEFFYSVTGQNAHYGTPINPRAAGRIPGGSSSGSAVAVASGSCDAALGGDTGGSVRIPAALCGAYGIRTTHGRVPARGSMAMAPSFDTIGWFAAGPMAFERIGKVLLDTNATINAGITTVLVAQDGFGEADAPVGARLERTLRRMTDALPAMETMRITPDLAIWDRWREAFRTVQGFEIWESFGDFLTRRDIPLGPGIAERMAFARSVSVADRDRAAAVLAAARTHVEGLLTPGTIAVLPTAPSIAPRIAASKAALEAYRTRVMRLTCIAGLSGLPQVTLPAGLVDGCPVGLSFIGWRNGDEALLDLTTRLARHCGD